MTKEELKNIKKEYETLESKFRELSDDELKSITGGTTESIVVLCSYTCPICGNTHNFNMEWHGVVRGFDIISFIACSKTREIIKIKNTDFSCIEITDTSNNTYTTSYNELGLAD